MHSRTKRLFLVLSKEMVPQDIVAFVNSNYYIVDSNIVGVNNDDYSPSLILKLKNPDGTNADFTLSTDSILLFKVSKNSNVLNKVKEMLPYEPAYTAIGVRNIPRRTKPHSLFVMLFSKISGPYSMEVVLRSSKEDVSANNRLVIEPNQVVLPENKLTAFDWLMFRVHENIDKEKTRLIDRNGTTVFCPFIHRLDKTTVTKNLAENKPDSN